MTPKTTGGQPRRKRPVRRVLALTVLLAAAVLLPGWQGSADRVTLTILGTTDIHGNVWPYDYLRGERAERGLAKVSSYVKQVRARQPNTLLVDTGDTFQGTPLAYYSAMKFGNLPNPIVAAMNAMGYDAMAVGNHEFNFGLRALWRIKEQAKFPVLAANIVSSYRDRRRDFEPYVIRKIAGPGGGEALRVAFLGMVTPATPLWDPPEHLSGYEFRDPVEVAKEYVPKLRKQADVVVVLIHSGLGAHIETGERLPDAAVENRTYDLVTEVPGIDVIFFGHSHQQLGGEFVSGAVLIQPKNWGQQVARIDLTLERRDRRWKITGKRPELVALNPGFAVIATDESALPPDEEILELTREAHERTERELNTVVARLDTELDARTGRIEDHPLVELIHRAQFEATGADVSLSALFGTFTRWNPGPVTMRDVYSLYFYENKLVSVEITGQQLKDALEHAVARYNTWPWPEEASPFNGPLFNLDMAQGVTYNVDVSRLAGDRIVDLQRNGQPLDPESTLTVALNTYRWSGGGGFESLRRARVVKKINRQVRELIAEHLRSQKIVDTTVDNNWQVVPPAARDALENFVNRPRR